LRGQWVDIDPSTWKTGRDLRISVTYGAGNKDAMAARLRSLLDIQFQAGERGYRIATEQDVYEASMELAKAADLPEKFFTDPKTLPPPAPPPPSPVEVGAQVEQMKVQSDEKVKAAELQEEGRQADLRASVDKYRVDKDQETRLLLEKVKAGDAANLEVVKAELKDLPPQPSKKIDDTQEMLRQFAATQQAQTQQLAQIISSIGESMNAPKKVIRDSKGKVVGIQADK